jgi:hypothetical protein
MGRAISQPKWWTAEHTSTWERVKEAMHRDWEQTKNDLHLGGRELDQDIDDTVKQVMGTDAIPPRSQPNAPGGMPAQSAPTLTTPAGARLDWQDVETPYAYGVGARMQFNEYTDWNDDLDRKLQEDWEAGTGGEVKQSWKDVRPFVKRGFDRAPH